MQSLGIADWDIGIIILILLILLFISLIAIIVLIVELVKLTRRFNRFTKGRSAKSLENEIAEMFEENTAIIKQTEKNTADIKRIYKALEKTYQKAGLVKYDAFAQMGGKLSFSLCMLNEKNDGFIINSVHGTDGCYTYSKIISDGKCDLALGDEEKKALAIAME